ncbi:zinc ABC transporter substrate-binding protein [Actibacterium sp. MT2.3-13A]|uniref:zinc ABC transporter substrate-binding protein n=1 Tax=Actibacterium sp. MT2.3-13A TaxID=2828332 RepID=UPI001BA98E25|nr:zinc ABC transporter substrate-binding protein [Actibacterium sp. MT2.3-13A]
MRLFLCLSAALLATPALGEVPRVMTDLPAVHSLAAQVMGDLGTPGILLDKGSDAHHFQLKPSQARALSRAGLVIWVGPEMTPWLDRAIAGVGLSGAVLELIELEGTHRQGFGGGQAGVAGDADHADADGHDHEGLDPHAWLTPENGRAWLTAIAEELSRLDPDNAATYAANAAAAIAALDETEARIRTTLAPVGDAPVVVFHDAYGYFAGHFGVNIAGTIAFGDAAAPGARHLAEIRAVLERTGAVCVFPEAQHDPAYVETLVEGTGVRVGAPLDPSGSALDYGPGLYSALLSGLAASIAKCVAPE